MVKKKKKKIDKRTWMIRIVAMGCALLMLATVIIAGSFLLLINKKDPVLIL